MAGNANSGRRQEKPFADALRMELKAVGEDHKALRMIAQKLIDKASGGDLAAIQELANRTDGKVAQQLIHTGDEEGGPVQSRVEMVIVDPQG